MTSVLQIAEQVESREEALEKKHSRYEYPEMTKKLGKLIAAGHSRW